MTKIKKSNKKALIIGVVILLILAVCVALYLKNRHNNSEQVTTSPTSQEEVNLNPPTEQDKQEAATHKEQLSQASGDPTPPPTNGKVTPVITSWGQSNGKVEVAARVPGILEEGGICTLTLKKGDVTRSGTSLGIANVSEVSCGFIAISRSTLTAGEWSATVAYSSSKATGVSEPKTITVE